MKADKKAEKRKRQRDNKKEKLADKRAERILRSAIVAVVSIVCVLLLQKKGNGGDGDNYT